MSFAREEPRVKKPGRCWRSFGTGASGSPAGWVLGFSFLSPAGRARLGG